MEYRIIRSKRKTVCLEITRGCETVVRAPFSMRLSEIERFVAAHEDWIIEKQSVQARRSAGEPTPEQEESLRAAAMEYIPARLAYYSGLMGLTPSAVKITSAKTRFGSCGTNGVICFSWRLMAHPAAQVDYVIVHELAHLCHHNHSAEFYALIGQYMPDYRERSRALKGQL